MPRKLSGCQRQERRQHRLHVGGIGEILLEQRLFQPLQLGERVAIGDLRHRQPVPRGREHHERHEHGDNQNGEEKPVEPTTRRPAAHDEAGEDGKRAGDDHGNAKSTPSRRDPMRPAAISSATSSVSIEMPTAARRERAVRPG